MPYNQTLIFQHHITQTANIDTSRCGDAGVQTSDAIAGICGLSNFANTCYMNSGLQVCF